MMTGGRFLFHGFHRTQDFTTDFGAVYLSEKGRRKVIEQWRARKRETIQHPFLKEKFQSV